ncbi:nuclear transport factor 2 family protein [Rhodococcus sp. 14-2470-1a]|uniref:nuclear transport factor 2 family protein n=1 Tax=Rhodococcus sp. 14-2470-1a TaxID=2023150 RepID=UPI000B9B8E35|nr:nuclear transport factor 2 family protein [Rhodococcus sp. 14-2470-1a]OZF42044.1 hypothetical protein CH292_26450 [Rhodococcus sp. 14-2470-1a]
MDAAASKEVVLAFFNDMANGNGADAMALLDDRATWWVSGDPRHVPIAGTYTKDTFGDLMSIVDKAMPSKLSMTVTSVTADVDRVAIEANPQGVSPTGEKYNNSNVFIVELRDGKITSIREYYDTMHTSAVFFGTRYTRP